MAKNPSFWSRLNVLSWFGTDRETYRRTERKRTSVARRVPFESLEERDLFAVVVTPTSTNVFQNVPAILIQGSGFDPIVANNSVVFNDGAGTVTGATDTALTVEFTTPPSEAGILTAVVSTLTENSGSAVQVATVVPTLTVSTEALAANASSIFIFGTGFDTQHANNLITFNNGASGTATASTGTRLTVSIDTPPTAAGPLTARVVTNSVSSGSLVQVAQIVPVVTTNTTVIAANATTMTINGFGFSTTNTDNILDFDGKAVGEVTAATATQLTVNLTTSPKVAGDLFAIVRTNGVSSAGAVKVATVRPVATVATTNLAADASTLTIDGFGFDTIAANNTVAFNNDAVGTVTLATATRLTVALTTKPTTAGVLNATVTTNGVAGTTAQVRTVTPVVTSRTVNVAANATSVTINGFGFDATALNNTVAFNNDATGTVVSASPTSITVDFDIKPTAAGSLTATVTTNSAASSSAQVATVTPVITLSTVDMAANVSTVVIDGFGFATTPGNNTVVFNNGAVGTVDSGTNTSLTVTLSVRPLTAGPLTAVVTSSGVGSGSAVQIKRITPFITSSTTNRGADQTTLVINGFGFSPVLANNAVTLDNSAVGSVTAATPTSITVTYSTKPVTAGNLTASILVNSISGGSAVQVATITPVVTSNAGNIIPVNASFVIITGYGFDTTELNNSVTFVGGAVGSITDATPTSLTVSLTTKPPKAGLLQATVTTNTLSSNSNATVASASPVVLANAGNRIASNASSVIVVGIGFDTTHTQNSIVFDSGVTGTVDSATATSLTVLLSSPPTSGNLNATVTTNGISNGSSILVGTVRPVVTSIVTSLAATANTITIQGSGFSTTAANNTVVFNNGAEGVVTAATATQLTVAFLANKKPTSAGSLTAVVTSNGVSSNSAVQVATVAPVITSRLSNLSPDATSVTINGFGFASTNLGNTVAFNNDAEGTVTNATATALTVQFSKKPKGAGSLTATVTSNGIESVSTNVQIASVIPLILPNTSYTLGFNATVLTIYGVGFDTTTPTNNIVLFENGAIGTVSAATTTSLTVNINTAPRAGGVMNAYVTTNGIGSGAAVQVAKIAPIVTAVTTDLSVTETSVTITGTGFDTTPGNNSVTFSNGAVGSVSAATATSLTVTLSTQPTSVGAFTAVVSTNGTSSGTPVQVATLIPVITSSTAALAANTTTLTINGFGFSANASENTVSFTNGAVGTVTSSTATTLSVTFTTNTSTVGALNATVTTNARASASTQVANVIPAVTLSTESLGASSGSIVIRGFGFSTTNSNNTVVFNNGAVGTVDSATATSLTVSFTTKPVGVGSLTAIVTTSGNASSSAIQVATVKPSVTNVTTGLAATSDTVTIAGFGFSTTASDNTVVFNNGAEGTVTAATATELTVTFTANKKPATAGSLTAVVTTSTHSSGAAVQVATVTPVATVSTADLAADASSLVINGFGFDLTASRNLVEFNNNAIGTVTASTATTLTVGFTTKPRTGGSLTVTVRTNDAASATSPQVATVVPVVVANSSLNLSANATTLVINGSGFDPVETNNLVTFNNGAVGRVTSATPTALTVTFDTKPTSAGSLTAILTTNGSISGSPVQVAKVAPVITSATTILAANAATVTIAGFGFDPVASNNTVVLSNGAEGTVTAATTTQLTVTFADAKQPSVGNLTAVVTSNSVSSGTAVQISSVIPVVTGSTAGVGFNASTIEINGFGFDTTASRNVVTFNNGAVGSVTTATATRLTVTYTTRPTSVGSLTASVATNSISNDSSPQVATIIPVITSSTASIGVNAATLTINGFGFNSTTPANNIVLFDNGAIGTVSAATATSLTVDINTAPTAGGNMNAFVTTNGVGSGAAVQVAKIAPVVTAVTTNLIVTETTVTITGTGFDTTPGNNSVTFSNGAVGSVSAATATSLTVTLSTQPTSVGAFTAVVSTNGTSSGTPVQVATLIPVVTSSTAALAANTTTLTINGFGFSSVASENTVSFTNGAVGTVTSSTATTLSITFTTNASAVGALNATVTTNARASVSTQVAYVNPAVTSSTESLGASSSSIVISGFGFSTTPLNNTVVFNNGAAGVVDSATATSLTVLFTTKPVGVGSLTAVVTTSGNSSGSAIQVATVKPSVTNVTTGLAATSDTVTIAGFGFSTTASDNTVVFNNGAEGTVTAATATELTVTFTANKKPATAGSLTAVVTTSTHSSGAAVQVATVTPVATVSTADLAADASSLVINGFGFDLTASRNLVEFNNNAIGTVTASTATTLTVGFTTKPLTGGSLTVTVRTNGAASGTSPQVGTVVPVVVANTFLNLSANATTLVINGFGFDPVETNNLVEFNNGAVGTVTSATSTALTVTFDTKPTSAGSLTAIVTTNGVVSGSPIQVAKVAPVITSAATTLAANAATVTIAGFGFDPVASNNTVVLSNGAEGTVTAATTTQLTVTFADAKQPSVGNLTAVVTSNSVSSGTAVQISSVIPVVTGSTAGVGFNASTIEINGFGFDTTASRNVVTFNNGAVGSVTSATATRLTVTYTTRPTSVGSLTASVATNSISSGASLQVATLIPVITSSTANVGVNDTTMTINGFGFNAATAANNVVTLNSGTGTVTAATATSLTLRFDTKPTSGNLRVSVVTDTLSSGALVQVATVRPIITSSTANRNADATSVTIAGFGFDTTLANNTVVFGSGAEGTVTAATPTSLTVTFADGRKPAASNLTAQVTTNSISSGTAVQIASVVPLVTTSTANVGINASTLEINGVGFDPIASRNVVAFNNGAIGTVTNATATRLTVTFSTKPTSVGSLTATVTTNSVASGSGVQVANMIGVINSTTTTRGGDESTLTINGFGFSTTAANNILTFSSGAVGTVTNATTTALTVSFSTRPKAGNLTASVVTQGVNSGTAVQVATIRPIVTTSVANLAFNSDTVIINGFGFDTIFANNTVAFNLGAAGNVTAATATSLTVRFTTRPTSLGNLTAVVTTNSVNSGSPLAVAKVVPVVTSSTANLLLTATTLTINGFGFDSATPSNNTVEFNNGVTGSVTGATATTLTVTFSGVRTAGNLTAIVTRAGVSSGTAVQVASLRPTVTSATTELLATLTSVTIAGTGFSTTLANNTVVFSSGAIGTVTNATSTALTVTFSTKPTAGILTAVVTTNGVNSGTAVQVALINPVVTSSTIGLALNGTSLVINGFGFSNVLSENTVALSGGAIGAVTAATSTSLTLNLTARATAVGSLTARVTTRTRLSEVGVQVAQLIANVAVPTVTQNLSATLAADASTVTFAGTNFSTTIANNLVRFSNGAIGAVTAATATSLTVTFSTKPRAGILTAIVTSSGALSGTAVQIASVTPVVTATTTNRSASESTLTITGAGFDTTPGNNVVTLSNGATGTVTAATSTTLTVTIGTRPTSVGSITAVVTTNTKSSGSPVQVARILPSVTLSTATLASNATSITINGFAFDTTALNNTVTFNNGAAGTVTAATPTVLTVRIDTLPTSLGNLTASVTTNSVSSGTAVQVATVRPVVTSSSTNLNGDLATLIIAGDGFSTTAANNTVVFSSGAIGNVTLATATALTVSFTTKPAAGSLTAIVTTNGVANGTAVQVANIVPMITNSTTSISPNASSITINGFGFDTTPSRNVVAFSNGATGTVSAATGTSLTVNFVVKPTSVGNFTAQVTTNGVSNGSAIQVATVVPTITSSTSVVTAAQESITIAGFGFSATAANNSVSFNLGAVGRITAATATQLTVLFTTKPTSLGNLTAVVTTNSVASGAPVQVGGVRPTVTAATTSLALTANSVVIAGTRFDTVAANNTVVFNNGAVGTVTSATATALTVSFSTRATAGNLTAVVTTNGVSSETPVQVATIAPVVTLSTTSQTVAGTTITIAGSGFDTVLARNTVVFSSGVGTVTAATSTSLTVTFSTRPVVAGNLTAVVTVNGASSGAAVQVARISPVVTSSTANLSAGAATMVINGAGFDTNFARNTVTFNNGAVGTVTAATATSLTVRIDTKPTSVGSLTAVVTTNSISSGSPVQVANVIPSVTASTTTAITLSTTTLTIRGFGFSTTAGNNLVVFNNGAVGNVTSATATQLTVSITTPPTAGNLTAVVTTSSLSSGTPIQVATLVPTVTANTSNLAADSSTVVIAGTGFDSTAVNNRVVFNNGAVGTVTNATSTALTVTFSTRPAAGNLTAIVTTNGASNPTAIQVGAVRPLVTASTTSLARTANTIIINGFGFSPTASSNTVLFNNGATGTVTAATGTRLTVTFNTKTTITGSLTAIITSNGVNSGSAVQVANMT